MALGDQVLWGFGHSDDGDSQNTQDEDESTVGVPDVAPTHVVLLGTSGGVRADESVDGQEGPGKGGGNDRGEAPPTGHEGDQPLLVAWQELEEDGCVEDEVASRAEGSQSGKGAQDVPVGRGSSTDGKDGTGEESQVKGKFATDDVGAQTPEEGPDKHAGICSNGQASSEGGLELQGGLASSDGL